MASPDLVALLSSSVTQWNSWRESHPDVTVDLTGADLSEASLSRANLNGADLSYANLGEADLGEADLSGANLRNVNFIRTNLLGANLSRADVSGARFLHANLVAVNGKASKFIEADFMGANLIIADLSGADLSGANLSGAALMTTVLNGANLTGCNVHGVSAWDLQLDNAIQSDLIITPEGVPAITVDDIEVAQFLYLLLNNQKVRHVIDTITSKVVLILGRFTPDRKAILDAIRAELRKRDYLPVVFDFDKPSSRDITETVSTLAHMARFVIADITDARSIPQELMAIVPNLPSVPVQPLLLASQQEYGMFEHFRRFPWVLETFLYTDEEHLLQSLQNSVVGPAEAKAKQQMKA